MAETKPSYSLVDEDKKKAEEAKAKAEKVEAEAKVAKEAKVKEAGECLEKAQVVLKEYDNQESNIPQQSEYWGLMNRYRGLTSK